MDRKHVTPSMLGNGRPSCPRCATRMLLARIGYKSDTSRPDELTADCPTCGKKAPESAQHS